MPDLSSVLKWALDNKEWLFSGVGLTFLSVFFGRRFMKIKQRVGGHSTINTGGDNSNFYTVGLSYSEVRQVCQDVSNANLEALAQQARQVAEQRVSEVAEKLFEGFISKQIAVTALKDPDFQFSLSLVQREYMRTGDKDLGDLLVSVLIERSQQELRGQRQIVLNEALVTLPKLTRNQIDILAFCCAFKGLKIQNYEGEEGFFEIISSSLSPFLNGFKEIESNYSHLSYLGCVTTSMSGGLASFLVRNYPDLFKISDELDYPYATEVETKQLENLFKKYAPELVEVGILSDQGSRLAAISLTSVGIAIGHAQLKRHGIALPSISEIVSD